MTLMPEPTSDPGELGLRLDILTKLRWLAVAGQIAAVLVVTFLLRFPVPLLPVGLTIGLAAAFNIGLNLALPANHRFSAQASALVLACDILQLSLLLYLTGGLTNPFAMLFLAPVLISATALPPKHTLFLGGLAVAIASAMALQHWPLPWQGDAPFVLPDLYVLAIWCSIVVSLAFIGVYAWRVAEEARQMAHALSLAELTLVRQQHITALDGVAAAAAHKLGTPLATIAVIAKEMNRLVEADDPLKEDVELLLQESGRCREILSKIASLGRDEGGPLGKCALGQLLEEVAAPHRGSGATIEVRMMTEGEQPLAPRLPGLMYSLGNLVENAVDFARSTVILSADWTDTTLTLTVADDGPGFAPEVVQRLGNPFLTTRPERLTQSQAQRGKGGGMGLGFFITKTLLERSGARITWGNAGGGGGARIHIVWPLSVFAPSQPRV